MRKFGYSLKGKHDYITVYAFCDCTFGYDVSMHDIVYTVADVQDSIMCAH